MIIKARRNPLCGRVLLFLFTTHTLFSGMPATAKTAGTKEPQALLRQIQIPPLLGTIQQRYSPESSGTDTLPPLVIHIQDAHGNFEAQTHTRGILRFLKRNYGIDLIMIEGGTGKISPDKLSFFEDPNKNNSLCERLMKMGLIGGAEAFLFNEYSSLPKENQAFGFGAEDEWVYLENVTRYRRLLKSQGRSEDFFKQFKGELFKQVSLRFHKVPKEFFKQWYAYNAPESDLSSRMFLLKKQVLKTFALDLANTAQMQRDWPQLTRFYAIQNMENSMSVSEAEKEREKLLEWMNQNKIPKAFRNAVKTLGQPGSLLETQEVPIREFLEAFYFLAESAGFRFEDYPHFVKLAGISLLTEELDGVLLIKEMDSLAEQILLSLSKTPEEKKLLKIHRDAVLLEKLFSLQTTREEYEKIKKNPDFFSPSRLNVELGLIPSPDKKVIPGYLKKMDRQFVQAMNFYEQAKDRDEILVRNTLAMMKDSKRSAAVLVTGGYHSAGILEALKRNHFSYLEIMPRINHPEQGGDVYHDLMALKAGFPMLRSTVSTERLTTGNPISTEAKNFLALTLLNGILEEANGQFDPEVFNEEPGAVANSLSFKNQNGTWFYFSGNLPVYFDENGARSRIAVKNGRITRVREMRSEMRASQDWNPLGPLQTLEGRIQPDASPSSPRNLLDSFGVERILSKPASETVFQFTAGSYNFGEVSAQGKIRMEVSSDSKIEIFQELQRANGTTARFKYEILPSFGSVYTDELNPDGTSLKRELVDLNSKPVPAALSSLLNAVSQRTQTSPPAILSELKNYFDSFNQSAVFTARETLISGDTAKQIIRDDSAPNVEIKIKAEANSVSITIKKISLSGRKVESFYTFDTKLGFLIFQEQITAEGSAFPVQGAFASASLTAPETGLTDLEKEFGSLLFNIFKNASDLQPLKNEIVDYLSPLGKAGIITAPAPSIFSGFTPFSTLLDAGNQKIEATKTKVLYEITSTAGGKKVIEIYELDSKAGTLGYRRYSENKIGLPIETETIDFAKPLTERFLRPLDIELIQRLSSSSSDSQIPKLFSEIEKFRSLKNQTAGIAEFFQLGSLPLTADKTTMFRLQMAGNRPVLEKIVLLSSSSGNKLSIERTVLDPTTLAVRLNVTVSSLTKPSESNSYSINASGPEFTAEANALINKELPALRELSKANSSNVLLDAIKAYERASTVIESAGPQKIRHNQPELRRESFAFSRDPNHYKFVYLITDPLLPARIEIQVFELALNPADPFRSVIKQSIYSPFGTVSRDQLEFFQNPYEFISATEALNDSVRGLTLFTAPFDFPSVQPFLGTGTSRFVNGAHQFGNEIGIRQIEPLGERIVYVLNHSAGTIAVTKTRDFQSLPLSESKLLTPNDPEFFDTLKLIQAELFAAGDNEDSVYSNPENRAIAKDYAAAFIRYQARVFDQRISLTGSSNEKITLLPNENGGFTVQKITSDAQGFKLEITSLEAFGIGSKVYTRTTENDNWTLRSDEFITLGVETATQTVFEAAAARIASDLKVSLGLLDGDLREPGLEDSKGEIPDVSRRQIALLETFLIRLKDRVDIPQTGFPESGKSIAYNKSEPNLFVVSDLISMQDPSLLAAAAPIERMAYVLDKIRGTLQIIIFEFSPAGNVTPLLYKTKILKTDAPDFEESFSKMLAALDRIIDAVPSSKEAIRLELLAFREALIKPGTSETDKAGEVQRPEIDEEARIRRELEQAEEQRKREQEEAARLARELFLTINAPDPAQADANQKLFDALTNPRVTPPAAEITLPAPVPPAPEIVDTPDIPESPKPTPTDDSLTPQLAAPIQGPAEAEPAIKEQPRKSEDPQREIKPVEESATDKIISKDIESEAKALEKSSQSENRPLLSGIPGELQAKPQASTLPTSRLLGGSPLMANSAVGPLQGTSNAATNPVSANTQSRTSGTSQAPEERPGTPVRQSAKEEPRSGDKKGGEAAARDKQTSVTTQQKQQAKTLTRIQQLRQQFRTAAQQTVQRIWNLVPRSVRNLLSRYAAGPLKGIYRRIKASWDYWFRGKQKPKMPDEEPAPKEPLPLALDPPTDKVIPSGINIIRNGAGTAENVLIGASPLNGEEAPELKPLPKSLPEGVEKILEGRPAAPPSSSADAFLEGLPDRNGAMTTSGAGGITKQIEMARIIAAIRERESGGKTEGDEAPQGGGTARSEMRSMLEVTRGPANGILPMQFNRNELMLQALAGISATTKENFLPAATRLEESANFLKKLRDTEKMALTPRNGVALLTTRGDLNRREQLWLATLPILLSILPKDTKEQIILYGPNADSLKNAILGASNLTAEQKAAAGKLIRFSKPHELAEDIASRELKKGSSLAPSLTKDEFEDAQEMLEQVIAMIEDPSELDHLTPESILPYAEAYAVRILLLMDLASEISGQVKARGKTIETKERLAAFVRNYFREKLPDIDVTINKNNTFTLSIESIARQLEVFRQAEAQLARSA